MIYPQPVRRHYHPEYTLITLAPVSYFCSLVVGGGGGCTGIAQAWVGFLLEDLMVGGFFSTVPGKNFDLCIISTRTKTHHINPLEKFSTSSEVPQNHNDLPSIRK